MMANSSPGHGNVAMVADVSGRLLVLLLCYHIEWPSAPSCRGLTCTPLMHCTYNGTSLAGIDE
jgi:hypothetical protein